jgi:hypothetical protein
MADADIKDFLTALSAADVKYIVVGAYAVAAHGHVRSTTDFDVWIEPSATNASRLARAIIKEFAGTSLEYFGTSVEELSVPRYGFYMGVEPDRIDVLTRIAGVRFERAWKGRIESEILDVPVHVLGLTELIAAKRASVRERAPGSIKAFQDAADLAILSKMRARRTSSRG